MAVVGRVKNRAGTVNPAFQSAAQPPRLDSPLFLVIVAPKRIPGNLHKMRKPETCRRTETDHDRVLSWLDARINYERTPATSNTAAAFGLQRMQRLLRSLGNPHLHCPVVHVAGTKGKGSTVAMLAAILQEAGHRVGRYLSPHVHRVEERIAVNGIPVSAADFVAAVDRVIPVVEMMDRRASRRGQRGPTWFEVMTAAAFEHFAAANVGVTVLETGLGGRLDATNVCRPLTTVITSISHDHMKLLGPTIAKIAAEKAGIIKRGCPVVCGATQPTAGRVIAEIAARRRAPLLQLGRDFTVHHVKPSPRRHGLDGVEFDLVMPHLSGPYHYRLAIAGRHQAENAALAVVAARQLAHRGIQLSDASIERGLAKTTLPARIETISIRPLVVVDAAHNVASMKALADTIRPAMKGHSTSVLVFAASGDKQVEKMLASVRGLFAHVVITRYLENPRAAPLDRLRRACAVEGLPRPRDAANPAEALRLAKSIAGVGGIVVVAGSFFLAAEVGGAGSRR
jgi:dihydrofolate synthase/folylpolyglutamate synthase